MRIKASISEVRTGRECWWRTAESQVAARPRLAAGSGHRFSRRARPLPFGIAQLGARRLALGMQRCRAAWLSAALLILAGCGSSAPAAVPPARAVTVHVVESAPQASARRYGGVIEPRERLDLAFKVAGRVVTLASAASATDGADHAGPLREGDVVQRGQVLAELDEADSEAQGRAADAAIAGAAAQMRASEQAVQQTERELARARQLQGTGALPQADLDRAETAARTARANLDAARAQRQGKSEQALSVRLARSERRLVSPIDGVVARRLVEVGSTVGPGVPAFTLVATDTVRAVFSVADVHIARVQIGAAVDVRVDAAGGATVRGEVSTIHPVADPQARAFAVEVALPNANGALRPGMVAVAEFVDRAAAPVLLVPLAAVVRPTAAKGPGDGFAVWVVDSRSHTAQQRVVRLGDLSGNDVAVEAGLTVGEQVVVRGAGLVHAGELVAVQP